MQTGLCLRFYLSESDEVDGQPAIEGVLRLCQQAGLHALSVLRGIEGLGKHGVHSTSFLSLAHSLPIVVEAVASEAVIEHALSILRPKLPTATMMTWPVQMISPTLTSHP